MKFITQPVEPIRIELARKQCKLDPEGSPPTHEDDDLLTEIYIPAAREWCEMYLGARIATVLGELAFTSFTDTITLEQGPVAAVDSVSYLDVDGNELVVDSSVYNLDTTGQVAFVRLNSGQAWPSTNAANDNIKVRYYLGYSAVGDSPQDNPLPASIKAAILLLLAHLYKNREATVEQALTTMPLGVKALLASFQIRKGFA